MSNPATGPFTVGSFVPEDVVIRKTISTEGTTIIIKKTLLGPIVGPVIPDPGEPCGLVSIEASNSGGVCSYYYTFKSENTGSGSGGRVLSLRDYREIAGSTSSQPITMHKDFSALYDTYGKDMRNGRVQWLDKDPDTQGGAGLSRSSSAVNPLLGVDNYLKAGSVYIETDFSASRRDVSEAFIDHVARISNPAGVDGGQNEWLGLGATITSVGSGYKIEKKWIRDPRGWIAELYA